MICKPGIYFSGRRDACVGQKRELLPTQASLSFRRGSIDDRNKNLEKEIYRMDYQYSDLRIDHAGGLASTQTEIVSGEELVRRAVAKFPRILDGLTAAQKNQSLPDYVPGQPYPRFAKLVETINKNDVPNENKEAVDFPLLHRLARQQAKEPGSIIVS